MPRTFAQGVFGLVGFAWTMWFAVGCLLDRANNPTAALSAKTLVALGALSLPVRGPGDALHGLTMWLPHVDAIHLASNLVVLLFVACVWPPGRNPLLLLVCGVLDASVAALVAYRHVPTVCCGGSGVLLSWLVFVFFFQTRAWIRAVAFVTIGLLLVGGMCLTGDTAAHVGGLLAGLLCLLLFRKRPITT